MSKFLKASFIFIISVLFLCSCSEKDLSEYGNSSLMDMANKKPSNAVKVSRTVSVPQNYDQPEIEVVLPEPSPEYTQSTPTPLVLSEEEKNRIINEFDSILQTYYDSIPTKTTYDAEEYFKLYDNETVRKREQDIAVGVADRNGITVEELFSIYPYQLQSDYISSLDREQIAKDLEKEGYDAYEDTLREIIDEEMQKLTEEAYKFDFYRIDNQYVINAYMKGLDTDMFLLYLGNNNTDTRREREYINRLFSDCSMEFKRALDKWGLKNGISTFVVYDWDDINSPRLIYTDGRFEYNYYEEKKN